MPINNKRRTQKSRDRVLDRQMLRALFQSAFMSVIQTRKAREGYQLKQLAEDTQNLKSTVSRWFSSDPPNWQIDTMADIADALDLEVVLQLKDRKSGEVHTALGISSEAPAKADVFMTVMAGAPKAFQSVDAWKKPNGQFKPMTQNSATKEVEKQVA